MQRQATWLKKRSNSNLTRYSFHSDDEEAFDHAREYEALYPLPLGPLDPPELAPRRPFALTPLNSYSPSIAAPALNLAPAASAARAAESQQPDQVHAQLTRKPSRFSVRSPSPSTPKHASVLQRMPSLNSTSFSFRRILQSMSTPSPTHTPPLTTNGLNTPQKKSEKKPSLLRKLVFTRDSSSSSSESSSLFMNAGGTSSARLRSPGFQLQPIRPQDEPQFSVSRTHTFSHQDAPSISARQNSIMGRLRDLVGPGASPQATATARYTTKPTAASSSSKKWSAKKWMQSDGGGGGGSSGGVPRVPKLFQRASASEMQQE
ncbi:hypothetical protein BJ741DRAFT_606207 [Chytriomyces cf. hyalinus JEL632]|nr:hypothetical protein BJ741DRAFT_606207 [Chytriomyces cf. hyalinus JEL632]